MSDVQWAIPGLMPPYPGNMIKRIIAPEDGSLLLLLWLGKEEDVVNYALHIPGFRHGAIKDPNYFLDKKLPRKFKQDVNSWPDYLYVENTLPEDTIVPHVENKCGFYVPLDEWCLHFHHADSDEGMKWFVLQLPPFTLPIGATTIEAVVNNKVFKYIVNRPATELHAIKNVTPRIYKFVQMKKDSTFVVPVFQAACRALDICVLRHPSIPKAATVTATVKVNDNILPLEAVLDRGALLVHIPALPAGKWTYNITYIDNRHNERKLVDGIIIAGEPGQVAEQNSITYNSEGEVDYCYLADKEDLSSLLNGTKFADGTWIYAPKAKNGTEAFSYSTCTTVIGTMDNLEIMLGMFRGSRIKTLPESLPAVIDARSAFTGSRLQHAPSMPSVTQLDNAFAGCTDLDTVPEQYPAAITADSAFSACDNLLYPCALPMAQNCNHAFTENKNLRQIAYTPVVENLDYCYTNDVNLVEVPDDTNWEQLQTAEGAFAGCFSLPENAILNILNALPDRSSSDKTHILTLPNTDIAKSVATAAAEAKGWTIQYN